jgi:hypothetical protein
VASVVFAEYPAHIFTNQRGNYDGCREFVFIDRSEAQWLAVKGSALNHTIREAATRNGWIYSGGTVRRFRGHGYCAGPEKWFRTLTESNHLQGNILGTAHPNESGHQAVAKALVDAFPGQRRAPAPVDITVEFTRVRLDDEFAEGTPPDVEIGGGPTGMYAVTLGVAWNGQHRIPAEPRSGLSINQRNRWITLAPGEHRFNFSVAGNSFAVVAASALPGLRVQNDDKDQAGRDFLITGVRWLGRFVIHRRADGWGDGRLYRYRSSTQHGGLEIEYRVLVRPNRFIDDLTDDKVKK